MLHDEKITTIANVAFRTKVAEGSFVYAKGVLLGTIVQANENIRRFCQIVLRDIATTNPVWLDGMAYFVLSTATPITLSSTQAQVNAEVVIAFPYFAKAWYGDIT